ncbi:hypothetical protein ABEB36_008632 [Hypothenemus hampei]|uniref:Uncharacterized protein n=1 Tax=Hypothenemus hampei TaxID=57062 RepID=A0ABD1ERL0_HYPHA
MSNIKKCAGKESLQRMNYLLQLANQLITQNKSSYIASLQYTNLMINISKKAVQRLDIDIKRNTCKGCRSILIPGITSKIRIKKKKMNVHCLNCSTLKIFEVKNPDYLPWSQKNESLVEIINYTPHR